jgi:hypothetical protein
MNRRTFLSALVVAPIAASLAACGDDNNDSTNPTTPQPLPDTVPTPGSTGIAHPTGPTDAVIKLSYEGGFVPAGTGVPLGNASWEDAWIA